LDLISEGTAHLKKVPGIPERPLPTAEELEAARKRAEVEPEAPPKEFQPRVGDGRTHLDLIAEGPKLKKVKPPAERPLPNAQELEEARKRAEVEPEAPPKEFQPRVGDGRTHLDLIAEGPKLKKVPAPPERPLPTPEQIAAEKEGK
jgi:broad specificity phosphatase PhoE